MEYSGPPLELVHFGRSDRSERNRRSTLTNRFTALPLFRRFHLRGGFGRGIENGKSHSSWSARFDRKMSFHFPRLVPLVYDWSV